MPLRRLIATVPILLAVFAAGNLPRVSAQVRQQTLNEIGAFEKLRREGRPRDAEKYINGLIEKYRNLKDQRVEWLLKVQLADLYIYEERTPEALPLCEEAVKQCPVHWGADHWITGKAMACLGRVYLEFQRTDESLALLRRARQIAVTSDGAASDEVMFTDGLIANVLAHVGRFQEAEQIRMRTLAWERRQSKGKPTTGLAIELLNLGILYYKQARHEDAVPLLLEANETFEQAGQSNNLSRAGCLEDLGDTYKAMGRYADAAEYYQKAHALYAKILGPDHPLAANQCNLADAYTWLRRLDEAQAVFDSSLKFAERYYGPASSQVYDLKHAMLTLYLRKLDYEKAEALASELLKFAEQPHIPRRVLGKALTMSALIANYRGKLEDACQFQARAIDLIEEDRATLSGSEQQRAQAMSVDHHNYNGCAIDHFRIHKYPEAFSFCERGRGRILLDQMAAGNVDLFAGLPPEQAQRLRREYEQLQNQIAALERRASNLAEKRELSSDEQQQLAAMGAELKLLRRQLAEAYAFIRNESPTLRHVAGQGFAGASLAEVQEYLKREEALMFYYVVAPSNITLIVIDGGPDIGLFRLMPPEFDRRKEYGTSHFMPLLANSERTGTLQLLAEKAASVKLTPKLRELGELLLPEFALKYIAKNAFKRLIIVPDGPLSMVPFEALVVADDPEPKYLLDVAPPILYAPSATILKTLQERPEATIPDGSDLVLAVGDPAYRQAASNQERSAAVSAFAQRSGALTRLPYSGIEATWVAELFNAHGVNASVLRQASATEEAVRKNAPNRRIVHLACHGLTDDAHGNFFAALALAPGAGAKANARDDGLLTLSELYELDLRACELSILSACQTNYGPQHDGEGVWALSRSFLVAGSRRVVASNWIVDDKAGASLISYFCGALVKQPKADTDYAKALQSAKRWVRDQADWTHPYYWATFVLIGPR
jgi:CHAT domain-containing protein